MKRICVVTSSLRHNSNSNILAESFIKGAKENGNEVSLIDLKNYKFNFCLGCMACRQIKKCSQRDDINSLLDIVQHSDVLVFVTPIYYYEMSGQLKTFLDRMNPLYFRENAFKKVYVIATAQDDDIHAFDNAINGIKGWVSCFEGVEYIGSIVGPSLDLPNEAKGTSAEKEAYTLGKSIN